MKHYGDITKLSGYDLPIVDVICGGSPCQDLSQAGNRAGLQGERSSLFLDQIRIVKEMREHDRHTGRSDEFLRPRYMVWENVPGAFSSNKGEDFKIVLTEIVKIAEPNAPDVPMPDGGGWTKSGCLYDEMGRWSIAWRVHDAQFWGVPQRRKRIALVADFGGKSAPEILFERKGLSGDSKTSGEAKEGSAADVGCGPAETSGVVCLNDQGGHVYEDGKAGTLRANAGDNQQAVVYGISAYESNAMKSGNPNSGIYEAKTARTLDLNGGSPACNQGGMAVVHCVDHGGGKSQCGVSEDVSPTLATTHGGAPVICLEGNGARDSHKGDGYVESDVMYTLNTVERHGVCVPEPPMIEMTSTKNTVVEDGISPTLTARMGTGGNQVNAVLDTYQKTTDALCASGYDKLGTQEVLNDMYVIQNKAQISATCTDIGFFQSYDEKSGTLLARQYKDPPVVAYSMGKQSDFAVNEDLANSINASGVSYVSYPVVRRLTPLECERLQGFPDGWTDIGDWVDSNGKKHKSDADSPRYKALGNSIALPFWQYLARRICAQYERDITIGSLFDGIGGFPYVFERCGAKAVWASEIEEFPIAVTKRHFPETE